MVAAVAPGATPGELYVLTRGERESSSVAVSTVAVSTVAVPAVAVSTDARA
jgi:hypothetical protein